MNISSWFCQLSTYKDLLFSPKIDKIKHQNDQVHHTLHISAKCSLTKLIQNCFTTYSSFSNARYVYGLKITWLLGELLSWCWDTAICGCHTGIPALQAMHLLTQLENTSKSRIGCHRTPWKLIPARHCKFGLANKLQLANIVSISNNWIENSLLFMMPPTRVTFRMLIFVHRARRRDNFELARANVCI